MRFFPDLPAPALSQSSKQHTKTELKLIKDRHRRNPNLGMVELWYRLRQRNYSRRPENLFQVMRKMGLFPLLEPKVAAQVLRADDLSMSSGVNGRKGRFLECLLLPKNAYISMRQLMNIFACAI